MANWSNPLLTSTYTNFLTEVKDRDTDLALQFDGTTTTNIPTNTIRWNSSVNRWQKWNGSSWAELTSTYALTGLTTTGNATINGTLTAAGFINTGSVSGTALLPTGNTVPTNGIYLPSTNVLGIATSSTARVIIDANGNVGIGTLSPIVGFHVAQAAASAGSGNFYVAPGSAGQARMRLYNQGGQAEWLYGQKTGTDHDFKLSKSVAGSESDYLTVTTTGSVGIGTTSPSSLLDVNGAITARGDGSQVALYMPGNPAIRNTGTATTTYIDLATGSASHGALVVRSSNTYAERFRIDSSGNVGIGTSSPAARLQVQAPSASRQYTSSVLDFSNIHVDGNTAGTATSALTFSSGSGGGAAVAFSRGSSFDTAISFWTNSAASTNAATERVRIDSAGRVGIGTSSPSSELDVNNGLITAGQSGAVLRGRFSSAFPLTGGGYFQLSTNNTDGSNGGLSISTLASSTLTERLRIDSIGRVGIGTTAPGTALDVMASAGSAGAGNIRIAPSTPGQARFHLYNGGATAEWLFGQKTSTDHDFKLSKSVAGSESDYLAVTTAGILQFDSGYGSSANAYGCRAWVNFNGTGTVAIRASANVSSITDNGTGDYTVNFTTAMPDANYAAVTDATDRTASRIIAYATGSARVVTYDTGFLDSDAVSVVVFR